MQPQQQQQQQYNQNPPYYPYQQPPQQQQQRKPPPQQQQQYPSYNANQQYRPQQQQPQYYQQPSQYGGGSQQQIRPPQQQQQPQFQAPKKASSSQIEQQKFSQKEGQQQYMQQPQNQHTQQQTQQLPQQPNSNFSFKREEEEEEYLTPDGPLINKLGSLQLGGVQNSNESPPSYAAYLNLGGNPSNTNDPQSQPIAHTQGIEQYPTHHKINSKQGMPKEISNLTLAQQQLLDPQYRKIFVGGLPHNLSDEEFRSYFIEYGDIEDCAILKDKRTCKPRGFGFVTYKSIDSVEHVVAMKDQHTIQGKWVDCKRAVPAGQMIKELSGSSPNVPESKRLTSSMPVPQLYQQSQQPSFGGQLRSQASGKLSQNPEIQYMPPVGMPIGMGSDPRQPMQSQSQGFYQGSQQSSNQNDQQDSDEKNSTVFKPSSQPFYRGNAPQQQQQQQQPQMPPQMPYQTGYPMMPPYGGMYPNMYPYPQQPFMNNFQGPSQQQFQSGFPYAQTYKQQVQLQQQQQQKLQQLAQAAAQTGIPLQILLQASQQHEMATLGGQAFPQFQTPQNERHMNQQQQEQTENHIVGLYSRLTLDDQEQNPFEPQGPPQQFQQQQPLQPLQQISYQQQQVPNILGGTSPPQASQAQQPPQQPSIQQVPPQPVKQKQQVISLGGNSGVNENKSSSGSDNNSDIKSLRDTTISNFNEEIKQKEKDNQDYGEGSEGNYYQQNMWQHQDGSQQNQISGFYTNYYYPPALGSNIPIQVQGNNFLQPGNFIQLQGNQQSEESKNGASNQGPSPSMANKPNNIGFSFVNDDEPPPRRSSENNFIRLGGGNRSPEPFRFSGSLDIGVSQPQGNPQDMMTNEGSHQSAVHGLISQPLAQVPQLNRVGSEGNLSADNERDLMQLRGRHILASGRDFQFGKDRPSSRADSDKESTGSSHSRGSAKDTGATRKPEFGQIRSETSGQSGPSKRSDRQYRPF